jgi:uncharacterized membrane protein YkoI
LCGCGSLLSQWEPAREVVCLSYTKVSLKDAIVAAQTLGGMAIDAHYHQSRELGCVSDHLGYYDVKLLTQGRLISTAVDARSGAVAAPRDERRWSGASLFSTNAPTAGLESALRSLKDAIELAENTGGQALKAYLEMKDGRHGYTVKLVMRSRVRVVWIAADRSAPTAVEYAGT